MTVKSQPKIADLAMLVARLIRQVRKHEPANDVAEKAMDYLRRHDLQGSVLREINDTQDVAIKDFVRRVMQWERDYDWEDRQVASRFCHYVREMRDMFNTETQT